MHEYSNWNFVLFNSENIELDARFDKSFYQGGIGESYARSQYSSPVKDER